MLLFRRIVRIELWTTNVTEVWNSGGYGYFITRGEMRTVRECTMFIVFFIWKLLFRLNSERYVNVREVRNGFWYQEFVVCVGIQSGTNGIFVRFSKFGYIAIINLFEIMRTLRYGETLNDGYLISAIMSLISAFFLSHCVFGREANKPTFVLFPKNRRTNIHDASLLRNEINLFHISSS